MSTYTPFLIIGLVTGSVYGLAAAGLVLTHKTTGIFNFGHGAVAAAAAMVFFELHERMGMHWSVAALISVIGFGTAAGLVLERIAAALATAPTAYRIAATVALILIVPAVYGIIFGPIAFRTATFLPSGEAFTIDEVRVGWDSVTTAILGVGSVTALWVFFQRSKLGLLMRGVVDRPELLDTTGYSPDRIRRAAWVIGSYFASVSGLLLINQQQQIDVYVLSLLVVQAFGAAVFGAFRSLPLAYLGGVILGVVQALSSRFNASHPALEGLDFNMPFIFLFVGLLVIRRGKLVELGQAEVREARPRPVFGPRVRRYVTAGVLVVAIAIPWLVGTKLPAWNLALAMLPLLLSLGLLVRTSGQIALGQIGFAAVGATTFAHMLTNGVPWLGAVLIAGLVTVPVGVVIAVPAIRLSGLYLALATLGYGILIAQFAYSKSYMFGSGGTLDSARPDFIGFDTDKGYYFLLLAFGLGAIAFVTSIERSRLGRLLRGMADSPSALTMHGTNTNVTRVLVFCASSFLAGISGALIAGLYSAINRTPFNYIQSIVILAALMIFGRRTVPAAILACLALTLPTAYLTGEKVGDYTHLVFGLAVILIAVSRGRITAAIGSWAEQSEGRSSGPAKWRTTYVKPTLSSAASPH